MTTKLNTDNTEYSYSYGPRTINPILLEDSIPAYLTPSDRKIEADWHIMGGGFQVCTFYYTKAKLNDTSAVWGIVTKKGKDLRRRGYELYTYTAEKVNTEQLAFAPQTLSGDGTGFHPAVNFDMEPLEWHRCKNGKLEKCQVGDPTPDHCRQVWAETKALVHAATQLASVKRPESLRSY
jgi:hypothetical protein